MKSIVVLLSILFSTLTFASVTHEDAYFEFDSVEVMPLERTEIPYYNPVPNVESVAAAVAIGEVIAVLDKLIAVGKQVWPIIKAGVPVNTTQMAQALSVLPRTNMSSQEILTELANWSQPEHAQFKVIYRNKLGMEIVSFVFNIYFQYNGSFNGNGKYLTSVTTQANHITSAWGFNLDAKSELVSIANVGSAKNPVASAILKVSTKAYSALSSVENSWAYYIDGKGNFKELQ